MYEMKKEGLVIFLVLAILVVLFGFFLISGDGITGGVIVANQLDNNIVSDDFNKIAIKDDVKNSNQVSSKSLDNEGLSISQGCSQGVGEKEFILKKYNNNNNNGWSGNFLNFNGSSYTLNSGSYNTDYICLCGDHAITNGGGINFQDVFWEIEYVETNFNDPLVLDGGAPFQGILELCTGPCKLDNSFWLEYGDGFYSIGYDTDYPFAGFQFEVVGGVVITNVYGGSSSLLGWFTSYSNDTILGVDLIGGEIPIGRGELLRFTTNSSFGYPIGISNLVVSDSNGGLPFIIDDGICSSCGTIGNSVVLINDVSDQGSCFTMVEDNIILDCDNHTITFGYGGNGDSYGVFNPNAPGVTVKDCNIMDADPNSGLNYGIVFGGSNGIIQGNNIFTQSGQGIFLDYGADGGQIEDNTILTYGGFGISLGYVNDIFLINNDIISVNSVEINDDSGPNNKNKIGYNNIFGKIEWIDDSAGGFLENLTLDGNIGFGVNNPTIGSNFIELNPNAFSNGNINSEVNLTFYNVTGLISPTPYKDYQICPVPSVCSNVSSLGTDNYLFTSYNGFSNFFIGNNNNPPQLSNVTLLPNIVFTDNDVGAYVNYSDLENQTGTIYFMWYVNFINVYNQTRNNILNGSVNVASDLSSINFLKNDQINVSVHASDGIINSTPIWSVTLIVQDAPPNITSAILNSTDHPLNLTDANLTAYWDFFDLDGDNITNRNISWYKNSNIQPSLSNLDTINSSETQKGEVWQFNISVETNTSWSNWYGSNLLTIENTPPVLSNILLTPGVVYTNDNLNATVDYDDIDNDPGVVNFFWYVNSVYQYNYTTAGVSAGSSVQSIFNSTNYSKGDLITVTVNSSDGTDDSDTLSSTITVQDTLPVITYAILNSTDHPSNLTDANLTAYWDFYDADGDPVISRNISWYKDSIIQPGLSNLDNISSSDTQKGEVWQFNISVQTDTLWSNWYSSNLLTIENTPPVLSNISLTPGVVYTNDNLNATVDYDDIDNDPGIVNFFWSVNGINVYNYTTTGVSAGSSVQSIFIFTYYSRDDVITVTVNSSDGIDDSDTLSSTITVQDTLPVITYAILNSTDHPLNLTDANLTAYWDFYDADNDLLDFSLLRWYQNWNYLSSLDGQQVLSFNNTNFGDIWYFNISVQAGGNLSDSLISNQLEILNSLPDTSFISFNGTSHNNYTNENLSCWIIGNDVDTNQNLIANWSILRGGSPFSNGFTNVTNGNITKLVEIDFSNTDVGENWICSARISDGIEDESSWNDASVIVREPQCGDTLTISPPPLTHDLYSNGTCFSVDGDNVTIDLNGYSLIGNGTGSGIDIQDSDNVTVINGTIQNFSFAIFADPSSGLIFDGLTIHSSNIGIHFVYIDTSIIRNNLIFDNNYGIYISDSNDNQIYNNFLNNTINAFDDSYFYNFWNQSYDCNVSINWTNIVGGNCSGGNYWSDYQGFDNGLGVSPYNGTPWNISGDGIGDTDIHANSSGNISNGGDHFPLMYYCYEYWGCSDWSSCSNSHQSRDCIDLNECGRDYNKPAETQSCSSGGGGGGSSKKECGDGDDNDQDGLTDYPEDPGCSSYSDDNEFNEEEDEEEITSSDDEREEEEIEEDKEDLIEEVSADQIIEDIGGGDITITSDGGSMISHSIDSRSFVRPENKITITVKNGVLYDLDFTPSLVEEITEVQIEEVVENLDKFEEKIDSNENYDQIKKLHYYLEKEEVEFVLLHKEAKLFSKGITNSFYELFNGNVGEVSKNQIEGVVENSITSKVVSDNMVDNNIVNNRESISGITHSSKLIEGSLFEPTITKSDKLLIDAGTEKVGELDLLAGISLEPKELDLILYSGNEVIYKEMIIVERSNIGTDLSLDHVNNLIDVYLVIPQIDASSITKHDYDLELNILGNVKEKQIIKVPVRFSAYNSFSNLFSGNNLLFTESYGSYVIAENDGYIFAQQLIYDPNVYSKEEYVLSLNVYQNDVVIVNNKFNLNLKTGVVTQIVDNEESINNNNFNGITGGVIAREGDTTSGTVDNFLSLMVVMILITLGLIYSNSIKRTVVKSVMNIGSKVRNNVPDSKTIKKLRKANHDLEDSFIRD